MNKHEFFALTDSVFTKDSEDDEELPEEQPKESKKLFSNLTFLFVPPAKDLARSLRVKKAQAFGATVLETYVPEITHIICEKIISTQYVLDHLGLTGFAGARCVTSEWMPDCLIYHRILEDDKYFFAQPSSKYQVSVPLLVKAQKRPLSQHTPESSVPSKTTVSPSAAFARSQDGLDSAIAAVEQLGTLRLEGEDDGLDDEERLRRKWHASFKCMQTHSSEKRAGPNDLIIEKLGVMLNYYETSRHPDDQWRVRGYRMAISSLKKADTAITSFDQAIALPNIGNRLAGHIVEINKTGSLQRGDELGEDYELIRDFMKIYGVGPTKAAQYVQAGLKSRQDILDRGHPNSNIKIGIALFDDLVTRIPRSEADEHKRMISKIARKLDPELMIYIMGSYRRGAETCGDLDFMVTKRHSKKEDLVPLWQRLRHILEDKMHYLTHGLLVSDTVDGMKWQGISKLSDYPHRRIDFLLVPWRQRGAALLYFTGNDLFNRSIRLLARKNGFRLNEKGLFKGVTKDGGTTGENTGAETEEEIFAILGVPYRPPAQRTLD